jgi:CDP-glucose 4,6-dehydratase
VEEVVTPMFSNFYSNRRVGITGHTGFKGAWLALWLRQLGAEVHGFSLPPPTDPNLHQITGASSLASEVEGDIRDLPAVSKWVRRVQPEVLFHLAAQPLVRLSYSDPLDTLTSCVLGTAHILEAARLHQPDARLVLVTTDKVYDNQGWEQGYRESDPLGGHDPYSSSKAATEIVIHSWRRSFFKPGRIASVRAGNVIGGGDYASERIVPDILRSRITGTSLGIRAPHYTRPWQHVLDCLAGYLAVGSRLNGDPAFPAAFNFGPGPEGNRSVADLVAAFSRHWPVDWHPASADPTRHEASLLNLAIDRACSRLGWRPVWNFERAVLETANWYQARHPALSRDMLALSRAQLDLYTADARAAGVAWSLTPSP